MVAKLNLEESIYSDLIETKKAMIEAATENTSQIDYLNHSNFHLIKFYTEEDCLYFGYYKGTRKNGKKKKVLFFESDEFVENDNLMIEIGGAISFVIHNNDIYIIQPRHFEFAFKYSDHITQQRDKNVNKLIELPFFLDDEVKEKFKQKSSNHLFSRGIASMSDDTFNDIEMHYNDRCIELKVISDKIKADPEIEVKFKKEKGILIDLIELIDFENDNQIILKEESDVKPLLHLFQDKIVETYLTKQIKAMIG